jgi:hypothetical protein
MGCSTKLNMVHAKEKWPLVLFSSNACPMTSSVKPEWTHVSLTMMLLPAMTV